MNKDLYKIEYIEDIPVIIYPSGQCIIGKPGETTIPLDGAEIIASPVEAERIIKERMITELQSKLDKLKKHEG